jgi:Uncharacterized conserved protein (DUF2358)
MPSFQSGTLNGLDRFIRKQDVLPDYYHGQLAVHIIQPAQGPFVDLYGLRQWETTQSLTYHKLHLGSACRSVAATTATATGTGTATTPQPPSATSTRTTELSSDPTDPLGQKQRSKEEQLKFISKCLADNLPQFFVKTHNYYLYNSDVVFENRVRNITTRGINEYSAQLTKYKTMSHILYAHVHMEVLKVTEHPEDRSVRVRWRIKAVGGLKPFFMFWKFFTSKGRRDVVETIDGFSIFYVGENGLIYKHVADKMMPDDERTVVETVNHKMAKLAGVMGFILPSVGSGLLGLDDV